MKARRVIYLAAAAAAVTAALVLPGTAGATTASNLTCGATLDHSIVLNGNLDCSGTSAVAVTITKGGVTLDLGGNTITGNNSYDVVVADDTCTDTTYSNCDNVTVTNGTISGGYDQVDFYGNSDTASNLTLSDAADYGVYLDYTTGASVVNNTITGAGDIGIYGVEAAGSGIMSNLLKDSYYENVYLDYPQGDSIEGNASSENLGSSGVHSGAENFYEDYGANELYYGNISAGGTYGFDIEPDEYGNVTVTNNGARSATDYGIYVYEAYNWTSEYGKGPVSLINGNTATNNDVGFYDEYSYDAMWQDNMANRNTSDGFEFYYSGGASITGNTAQYNGADGFYVSGSDTYYQGYPLAAFSGNNAWYNQDFGFESDYPINGSGNAGQNAGGPTNNGGDCYQVAGCS